MKHKMWSRLLSMVLAVMMITSIVPNSAFAEVAEAAGEVVASSQQETGAETGTEPQSEVTMLEESVPAEGTDAQETPTAEPEESAVPEESTVPSEQPSAEPDAESLTAPEESAVPAESAAPEESTAPQESAEPTATPAPSESPAPTATPEATEEPAAIDGQALLDELMAIEDDEAFMQAVSELTEEQTAALEALGEEALVEYALRVETLTAQAETVELNAEPKEFTTAVEGVDGVTVTVKVPEGALPVDTKLVAQIIAQDSEEYTKTEQALEEKEETYDGMVALDIRFELNGEEIEPALPVEVTIDAKAILPENADPESVTVQHLEEDENGEVVAVKTVADATEETGEVTVEENQIEEPAMDVASTFTVDGFSTFAVTWNEAATTYAEATLWGSAPTVSTKDKISINLFDYDAATVNSGHALQFESTTLLPGHYYDWQYNAAPDRTHPNYWTSLKAGEEGGALQGIVGNTLVEGYPVLRQNTAWNYTQQWEEPEWWWSKTITQRITWNTQGNESLDYLFAPNDSNKGKTKVIGADKLFQLDNEGYYVYDSASNAARINTQTGEFTVYGSTETAGFNPFGDRSDALNPHFGMTIETQFVLPPDGKINGQNMRFDFSGDDDVWVFVDDVLVLDIGGIHGAVSGSIDFSTGDVTVNNVNGGTVGQVGSPQTKKLAEIFQQAGSSWDAADYSTHTLKFFYLERGAGSSNCKIRFNLTSIPKGSLNVGKTAVGEDNANIAYKFQLVDSEKAPVPNAQYSISGTTITGKTDSNGYFTLKAGQMATFTGLTNGNYTVKELEGVDYQLSDYTTTVAVVNGDETSSGVVDTEGTVAIDPNTTGTIGFTNTKIEKGAGELTITKSFVDSDGKSMAIPEDLAEIRLTVVETDKSNNKTTEHKISLKKGADDVFSATLDVEYYTEISVKDERLLNSEGELIANGADWTQRDFILNRYAETDAEIPEFQSPKDTTVFTLQNSAYILVQDANQWYLVMNHVPQDPEGKATFKTLVIDKILAAVANATHGNKPTKAEEVELLTVEEAAQKKGAEVSYQEGGNTVLKFEGHSMWSNFYYGSFDMTNVTMQATLKNVLNKNQTTSVNVTKVWKNADETPIQNPGVDSVTIELWKTGGTRPERTIQLNAANDWRGIFTNLSKYNEDGSLIQYTVKEQEVSGYTSDITGTMKDGYTVTNTPSEGYLKINKIIQGNKFGNGKDVFSFKIEAISGTDQGKVWYMQVDGADDAYYAVDGEGKPLTELKLDAGEYTVTELDNINYQFVDVDSTDTDVQKAGHSITVTVSGNETTQVTFTNTPKNDPGITDGSGVINKFTQNEDETITITGVPAKKQGSKDDTEVTGNPTTSGN